MRPWLLVVLAACDKGERLAARQNARAAAIARELETMRELEASMCQCRTLDCLAPAKSALTAWWDGLGSRLGPPTLDEIELGKAEALGRSADVCFVRTITQSFLRTAEEYRQALCKRTDELEHIIEGMRAYADDLERLPGKQWPRLVGDEHERAYASLTHFAACAEAVAPGVQSRLPSVFRTWVDAPQPEERGPTVIYD